MESSRKKSGVRSSSSKRLLLVEDDRMMARALQRNLGAMGFEIELASSVAAARTIEGEYACGVFDIDLPDGSGLVLAKEMIASGVVQKVVFFSASTDAHVTIEAHGVGEFVSKLDGLAALQRVLHKAMHYNKATEGTAAPRHEGRRVAVQMAAVRIPKS